MIDIKPDNILYIEYPTGEFQFKIADFSTMIAYEAETKSLIGTNAYIGPKDVFEQQSAKLKRSKRFKRIKNIENLNLSFDDLINELDIPRDMSRNPIFDVWADYHKNEINLYLTSIRLRY